PRNASQPLRSNLGGRHLENCHVARAGGAIRSDPGRGARYQPAKDSLSAGKIREKDRARNVAPECGGYRGCKISEQSSISARALAGTGVLDSAVPGAAWVGSCRSYRGRGGLGLPGSSHSRSVTAEILA